MGDLFLNLLDMSITAGWLVPVVLVLRLVLRKTPKALICVLWALVAVRLVLPFSFESRLSLVPETTPVTDIVESAAPDNTANDDILTDPGRTDAPASTPAVGTPQNDVLASAVTTENTPTVDPWDIAAIVWLVGMCGMLIHSSIRYLKVRRMVKASIRLRGNIRICDDIPSPFIFGVLRPRIYLPSYLKDAQQAYVIAHEQAHLKRGDHYWKQLGYLLLSVYWFNPLIWVAYILLCRDIELACDERVIRGMNNDDKKNYSVALLQCSMPRRFVAAYPLAFGEVGVKQRIKSVLKYRKPKFLIVFVSVVLSVAVSVLFLTDPVQQAEAAGVDPPKPAQESPEQELDFSGGLQYIHYVCQDESEQRGSTISLVPTENKFTFSLSYGNFYTCFGAYTETGDTVIATAQEGNKLVFRWVGNDLVFVAAESDPIPSYYAGDETALPDGTVFSGEN